MARLLFQVVLASFSYLPLVLCQQSSYGDDSCPMITAAIAPPFYVKANRSQCDRDIARMINGVALRQPWALQMIDASGKIPSGILVGNLIDLGSYSQCYFNNINGVSADNETYSPNYCVAYLKVNNDMNKKIVFWLGLCLPASCNEQDIADILQNGLRETKNSSLDFVSKTYTVQGVVCQAKTLSYNAWSVSAICFLSIIAAVAVVATSYELYVAYRHTLKSYYDAARDFSGLTYKLDSDGYGTLNGVSSGSDDISVVPQSFVDERSSTTSAETITTHASAADVVSNGSTNVSMAARSSMVEQTKKPVEKDGLATRVLLCFSWYTNGEKVMNTDPPKTAGGDDQISCAHGMRFISMTWVILGHTYYVLGEITFNGFNPLVVLTDYMKSWEFMAITSGVLSVDTFFTMSGLLTTYLTLKQLRKIGGPKELNWALFYVHRYLRLTPVYAITLFLVQPLFRYLYYGPIWPQRDVFEPQCSTNWWTNLLYINNVVNDDKMCMGHTWYLANDMQFYIISPLVIIPWFYSGFAGFILSGALVALSIISTAVITVARNYSGTTIAPIDHSLPPEGFYQTSFHDIYTKPYSRVGAYAVGMMAGYIMYRINGDPARKERVMLMFRGKLIIANMVGWMIVAFFALGSVYGPYDMQSGATIWSTAMNAFYASCSRVAWSISISYIIIACAYGYGGWVNRFLSWRVFVPLSRLTYAAYLIHLYVISFLYYSAEQPVELSVIYVIYYYCGHIALSYALAFCLSMLFEAPMFCLEKIIFKR